LLSRSQPFSNAFDPRRLSWRLVEIREPGANVPVRLGVLVDPAPSISPGAAPRAKDG
jgi:hypothetical protein